MMKIALDVMGFENDVNEAIIAAREFIKKHQDLEIILVGNQDLINPLIKPNEFNIVHTSEFVLQDDTVFSARRKQNSSIQICANLLKEKKVDGILSACNSGIFVFTLYSTIGTIPGINKLGFMPTIPKLDGIFNMVDVGASIDVNQNDLVKFAIMANEYAKQFTTSPVIKLLNIGTEEHKGKELQVKTNEILKSLSFLNYQGYLEPNKLLNSDADVVIADAFTGNIALKTMEGTAKTIGNALKTEFKKPKNLIKALFAKSVLKKISKKFDYKENAGAFVLGLNEMAVKTHGSADRKQFLSALRLLYNSIKFDVLNKMKEKLKEYDWEC